MTAPRTLPGQGANAGVGGRLAERVIRSPFQSTPPWWGRPRRCERQGRRIRFQSTPPWWGRLLHHQACRRWGPVSIHAPVVGATACWLCRFIWLRVSIHAPVVGATRASIPSHPAIDRFNPRPRGGGDPRSRLRPPQAPGRFNPRPRGGGDHEVHPAKRCGVGVSIHAPVVGATSQD